MKQIIFVTLFFFSSLSYGQDLLSRKAPIDKRLESVDSTMLEKIINKGGNKTANSFYHIGRTIVKDNNEGWEWLKDEKSHFIEEYYPLELRYNKYDSHPHYYIVDDDVYDNNGKLVRAANFVEGGIDFLVNAALRQTYIEDYRNNKYSFKKEDANAQNYVKEKLGLITSKLYIRYSSAADNYLRQLEVDHENDFKFLQICERLDNLSFKVSFGELGGKTTSTWIIVFTSNKKFKSVFSLTKLPIEQVDWSLYADQLSNDNSQIEIREHIAYHKVKKGETLQSIARKRHITVDALCCLNKIGRNIRLQPGQIIKINSNGIQDENQDEPQSEQTEEQKKPVVDSEEIKDESEVDYNKIFDVVEEMPQFPGGPSALFEYISRNQKYPVVAEENGIQGRVIVRFVIDKDGSVIDPIVKKSVDPTLDNESLRIINTMPKWIPGKQNGKAVKVSYTIPITFKLQ